LTKPCYDLLLIALFALFAWLISHQPTILFSQTKPVTNNQSAVLFSQNKPTPAISHQPNEQAAYRKHYSIYSVNVNSNWQNELLPFPLDFVLQPRF
jgi:hypothetical protein